jgi:hypothetical protein
VIKGWTEAMQLMVEGDKWEMYAVQFYQGLPAGLGVQFYQDSAGACRPPIPPHTSRVCRYVPSHLGYGDRGSPPQIGVLLPIHSADG